MAKTTRRESREIAFALLFEWSFHETPLDEMIELAGLARGVAVDKFAYSIAEKAIENRSELDMLINQYSQGWKLSRISRTLLSVLRMSLCEMTKFEGNIPVGASINEAVELVKKYGTDQEAVYLNGLLGSFDQVRRGVKQAPPIPEKEESTDDDTDMQKIQKEQKPYIESNIQNIDNRQEDRDKKQSYDDIELVEDIIIEVD